MIRLLVILYSNDVYDKAGRRVYGRSKTRNRVLLRMGKKEVAR